MSKKWSIATGISYFVIFTATMLAYLRLIPLEIKKIPHYDSIGHFLLFGLLAFTFDHALKEKDVRVWGRSLPLGALLVACYACIDESLQFFSSARSFDLTDLFFGLLGVVVFVFVGRRILSVKK